VLGEDREKKGKEEDPTFISSPSSSSFTFLYVNEMEEVEEEMKVKDGERSAAKRRETMEKHHFAVRPQGLTAGVFPVSRLRPRGRPQGLL